MNKEKRRVPKLRFPGFTEDWEQRKLGDFYTFKNGLNKEKVYFGYGDSIVNFTDVFHNRQIYSSTLKGKVCVNKKELENYKVKEGDLFFTRTSETIDEIGFPAVVMEPMERVVFSGFVLRGRAEKNDPLVNIFKSYIFFTDNFRSEMKKKSSMTTRALTSGTALKEMYFSYPKDLEEQTKIGEILLRLDNIITLHQRKLEHLNLKKKALLQKLFPKNGERHPELRFPGFTDAWEQRKLGEFVKIVSGDAPSTFISGNCIYVKVDDLNYSDRIQLSSSNLVNANSKAHLVNQGATIFPKRGAAIMTNKVRIMGKDGYLDTNMMALIPEEIDKDFLFTFIQKTGLYKIADTSTIPQINNKHIEPYIIQVPSEKEQAYIGVVFEKIDKIITLHQRKLEHLQLQKKALLQQMFV